jgi:hypothetical protein
MQAVTTIGLDIAKSVFGPVVRFWHEADITPTMLQCQLMTQSGHLKNMRRDCSA